MQILLVSILLSFFSSFCQTKFGIILQGEFNRGFIKGSQSNSHLIENVIKQRVYVGGKFGILSQVDLYKNIKIESQVGFNIRGISYKRNQDSLIKKNRGSYNLFGIEIPLCVIIEFPSQEYTSKNYIGFGPVFNLHMTGIWKYNEVGQKYIKQKMTFSETDWSIFDYGITSFIGLEDSQNQNLRIGINYFTKGLQNSITGKVKNNQLFVTYCYLF